MTVSVVDVEKQVTTEKALAEAAVAAAQAQALAGVPDQALSAGLRAAQLLVDLANREGLNLCEFMWGRWRREQTEILLGLARGRWGMTQTAVVPMDSQPL
jgi:hypothetical protein